MNLFLKILFLPFMIFFNVVGGLSCLTIVGYVNGYEFVLDQLKKANEK